MNNLKLELIISIIDKYIESEHKDVLTAVEAGELLDKAGVLYVRKKVGLCLNIFL